VRLVLDQGSAHVGAGLDLVLHEIEQHNGVGGHREIEQHGGVDDHNVDQHQQADERGQVERVAGHRQGDEGADHGRRQRAQDHNGHQQRAEQDDHD
jgi:hypothetical protein